MKNGKAVRRFLFLAGLAALLLFASCGAKNAADGWRAFATGDGSGEICGGDGGILWTANARYSAAERSVTFAFSEPPALAGCTVRVLLATGEATLTLGELTLPLHAGGAEEPMPLWIRVAALWKEDSVLSVTDAEPDGNMGKTGNGKNDANATKIIRLASGIEVYFDAEVGVPLRAMLPAADGGRPLEVKFNNWQMSY